MPLKCCRKDAVIPLGVIPGALAEHGALSIETVTRDMKPRNERGSFSTSDCQRRISFGEHADWWLLECASPISRIGHKQNGVAPLCTKGHLLPGNHPDVSEGQS
jgi:hypothetical protein